MMEKSRRARRMERNHKGNKQPAINLVSLMDVFTILVFFLLLSSSNVQQLPKKKDIHLPTSVATKMPKETLIIAVTQRNILVQGKEVAIIQQVISNAEPLITGLEKELIFQASKSSVLTTTESKAKGRAVTIMGDENIQYDLLRKILATCREANYTKIAFAAMQQASSGESL
ncbi:MAG: ExbD/TolR family protein [Gammaproteobacteria bacterium]